MVNFGKHWTKSHHNVGGLSKDMDLEPRARKIRARRSLIESVFAKLKDLGERLRCRRWVARCNEA